MSREERQKLKWQERDRAKAQEALASRSSFSEEEVGLKVELARVNRDLTTAHAVVGMLVMEIRSLTGEWPRLDARWLEVETSKAPILITQHDPYTNTTFFMSSEDPKAPAVFEWEGEGDGSGHVVGRSEVDPRSS